MLSFYKDDIIAIHLFMISSCSLPNTYSVLVTVCDPRLGAAFRPCVTCKSRFYVKYVLQYGIIMCYMKKVVKKSVQCVHSLYTALCT